MEYFYLMIGNIVLCILVHIRGKLIGRKEQTDQYEKQVNKDIEILNKEKDILNMDIDLLNREIAYFKDKKDND